MYGTNPRRPAPPQAVDQGIYAQSPLHWSRPLPLKWIERYVAPALAFGWVLVIPLLCGACLQWLTGSASDWLLIIPGAGWVVGVMAWSAWVHNKPAGVKKMIARTTLLGLAATMTILGASYGIAKMMSARYVTHTVDGQIFVVDRLMGDVRLCDNLGCSALGDITAAPGSTK